VEQLHVKREGYIPPERDQVGESKYRLQEKYSKKVDVWGMVGMGVKVLPIVAMLPLHASLIPIRISVSGHTCDPLPAPLRPLILTLMRAPARLNLHGND
jgi:hypothetical protein